MKYFVFFLSFSLISFFSYCFYQETKKVTKTKATAWLEDHSADCGVVLTGNVYRIQEGFDLLNQGQVKKLIISGVNPKAKVHEIFPILPFYGSIDMEDVVLEKHSLTTYGNAQQSSQLMEALLCRDVVLITSTLHMYRAHRTFKAILPENFTIYKRAIVSLRYRPRLIDVFVESSKSLFYSFWAY